MYSFLPRFRGPLISVTYPGPRDPKRINEAKYRGPGTRKTLLQPVSRSSSQRHVSAKRFDWFTGSPVLFMISHKDYIQLVLGHRHLQKPIKPRVSEQRQSGIKG